MCTVGLQGFILSGCTAELNSFNSVHTAVFNAVYTVGFNSVYTVGFYSVYTELKTLDIEINSWSSLFLISRLT